MEPEFDNETKTLGLRFDSEPALAAYLERAAQRSLVLVRLPVALAVGDSIQIRLSAGTIRTEVDATVQQVFRSGADYGVALRPATSDLSELARTPTAAASAPSTGDAAAAPPAPDPEAREIHRSEMTGASIATDIRKMNVSQKMRLASRASRLERQVLLRDTSPQVLMGLLTNPRIDEGEVRDLVRSPHAASGVLQHVAKDRRWSSNYEIRHALVRNPKTPTPLAQRLLPTLRKSDLKTLAKSNNVREAIKGAALRLYLGKI